MDDSPTASVENTNAETKHESSEKWIRDYLIPTLINDGKVFDISGGSSVNDSSPINSSNNSNAKSGNQIQVVSVSVKAVSLDGFMLSAPSKVEIEFLCGGKGDVRDADENQGGKSDSTQQTNKVCLVVKRTPAVPKDIYDACQFEFLFENELIAYTEIIPLLSQAKKYPRFYYSERKELSAVCVLEDFSQYGWRSAKQLYNLPLQHILMAVRELATFHGEMYAHKSCNLLAFNRIAAQLKEARIANGTIHPEYVVKLVACRVRLVQAVKTYGMPIPEEFLEMFMQYTEHPYTMFKRQFEPIEPLANICHGDYLRNNISFKFDDNDLHIDVMMYDFQTMRYASPMLDLTTLLIVSASHEVRAHFDEIFAHYHETLVHTYRAKTQDMVPQYLSADSLMRDYARHLPNAIIIAASFLPILYTPIETDSIFDMQEQTHEETVKDAMERGGAALDRELAHIMHEFYQLCNKFQIEFN